MSGHLVKTDEFPIAPTEGKVKTVTTCRDQGSLLDIVYRCAKHGVIIGRIWWLKRDTHCVELVGDEVALERVLGCANMNHARASCHDQRLE